MGERGGIKNFAQGGKSLEAGPVSYKTINSRNGGGLFPKSLA